MNSPQFTLQYKIAMHANGLKEPSYPIFSILHLVLLCSVECGLVSGFQLIIQIY